MDEGPAQMHYMPARFRSLAGGGWVTISSRDVHKSLMPMPGMGGGGEGANESAVSGGAMKDEVKINLAHGDPDGERSCDLVHYKSSSNKLVCSPRAVDCCLDGLTAQELARVSHGCPSVKPELNVEVNGQRLTWGSVGKHGRDTLTDKSLEVRYGQTPTIVAVEPAEVRPGELITVYGRTCFGDVWKKDEDDGSSLRDDPDALRDLFSVEASAREDPRQEIGLEKSLYKVLIGGLPCEVRDPLTNRYYRSERGDGPYMRKWYTECGPVNGWFQCRVPQDIEPGVHLLHYETYTRGNAVILSEALRWNASDASKGYVLSVVDDKSEDEDPPRVYNITKLSKNESKQRLLVEGASLDAPNIVVELDGKRCGGKKVVSRSRIEVECSGSAGANSQYHYGPPAWLREDWVFKDKNNNFVGGKAWSKALHVLKQRGERYNPLADEVMDALSSALATNGIVRGYKIEKVQRYLASPSVGSPYASGVKAAHAGLIRHGSIRNAVFERVSGVITAKANGRMRVSIANQAGNSMVLRVRHVSDNLNLLKPWLLVSKFWGSKYGNQYDFSPWFSVRGNEKYYMEFLMNLDPRHRRKDGGFNVKMEFSYDAGNPAGSIGQITHTTMPHVPKRARGGDYVVRFSGASKTAIKFAHNATSSRGNFEWKLFSGGKTIEFNSKNSLHAREHVRKVRDALRWANCTALPEGSKMWDADSTHSSHPFDVEDRWLTVRDTQTFKHPTTNWNIILHRRMGGFRGASIDWSTSYCSTHSQKFDLSSLPPGRVITPSSHFDVPASSRATTNNFLNFAYKVTQGTRATLLLRLKYRSGKRDISTTCAVLLTHEQARGNVNNFDHPACVDLRSVFQNDGEWHFISFNWRTALAGGEYAPSYLGEALFPHKVQVQLDGIGVGAQRFLSKCPNKQRLAEMYVGDEGSELRGHLWLDSVSVTRERYSPQRVKTPSAQLGGMQEGIHAITDIDYSVVSRSDGSKCKSLSDCDIIVSLRQVKKCVDAQSRGDFNISPVLLSKKSPNPSPKPQSRVSCGGHYAASCSACPWKGRKWKGSRWCNGECEWSIVGGRGTCVLPPAPTPPAMAVMDGTSSTRGTVTVRSTEGTMTQFSTSARSSEVQDALRHVLGAHDGGFMVSPSMDLFDVCGVSAHRMRSAYASDLESIQARYKEVVDGVPLGTLPKSSRGRTAENDAGLLNITVNVSGGLAEIVALDESSDFIGMVPLNTRTDLDVRALIRGGDAVLSTAVVKDGDAVVPCFVSPDLMSATGLKQVPNGQAFVGDASCHIIVPHEEVASDATVHAPTELNQDGLPALGESVSQSSPTDQKSRRDVETIRRRSVSNSLKFPGHDTWAKRDLSMNRSDLERLTVTVVGSGTRVHNGAAHRRAANHARKLLETELVAKDAGQGSLTNTKSKYEFPAGAGRFSDPSTWGARGVPDQNSTDMLFIPAGFNLTLDVADTYFRVWVIEGHLHFQRGMNITMQAEIIVINGDDAHFSIGSETHPFEDQANIIMHGHWRSLGLPKYGVKCISLTSGRLTFYGQHVTPWMELATTAAANANVISVRSKEGKSPDLAGWKPGASIVVTSTSYGDRSCRQDRADACQPEERVIQSVTPRGNFADITLDRPLKYEHLGESVNVAGSPRGATIERRAEVMLLTRNINVRGTTEHNGYKLVGFGAHTMMMSGQMVLKNVEFGPNVGQAFQLGRYAIHYHTPNEKMFKYGFTATNNEAVLGDCSNAQSFQLRAFTFQGRAIAGHPKADRFVVDPASSEGTSRYIAVKHTTNHGEPPYCKMVRFTIARNGNGTCIARADSARYKIGECDVDYATYVRKWDSGYKRQKLASTNSAHGYGMDSLVVSNGPWVQGADQRLSRVEGVSVHQSNNRAIAVHGSYRLNIINNVAYNILGHGMFVEDGVEMWNLFKDNVVSLVHRSFSLLNTDQTPAAFWISNANNFFIGNRVSSSNHHGYWFDPPRAPTGPSSRTLTGPLEVQQLSTRTVPLGQFENNRAHSNGHSGLWIDKITTALPQGGRLRMYMVGTHVWNNGRNGFGMITDVGHLQIVNTFAMGNGIDIMYIKSTGETWAMPKNGWSGNLVYNATLRGDPKRNTQAIGCPHGGWVTFNDVLISGYQSRLPPIHHCAVCPGFKGGMEVRFMNMKFVDSDTRRLRGGSTTPRTRILWNGYNSNLLLDVDGTLSGSPGPRWAHSVKGASYDPKNRPTGHFPPEHCTLNDHIGGVVCDANTVSLREVQWRRINPMTLIPMAMQTAPDQKAGQVNFYHYDHIERRFNWRTTLVMVKSPNAKPYIHNFTFKFETWQIDDPEAWYMEVRELQPDEWAIMRFPTFRNPWRWGLNSRIPAVTLNNYNQSDYSFNESKAITATSNEWLSWKDHKFGDHTYLPVVETRDANVKPDPGLLDIMISGKREHGWRQSHALGAKYDGTREDMPVCTTKCASSAKSTCGMKRYNCAPGDKKRCLPMEKPANCFDNRPAPEVDPEPKTFSWCESNEVWSPPAFGDDVTIKAGWTVILDETCLVTNITRHVDLYGSLLLRDPGAGKTIKFRAQTIHVAAGIGYLEAGDQDDPISHGDVRIELYGNRFSNARMGYGMETKYIAVLGHLSLVGKANVEQTWSTLRSDAPAGSSTIETKACGGWNTGDTLMIGGAMHNWTGIRHAWYLSAERCDISSIAVASEGCVIRCTSSFNFTHSGPAQKHEASFGGMPVTLMHSRSRGGRVQVVGMEDKNKALAEQHYGAVLAILKPKKKGFDYAMAKRFKMEFKTPERINAAIEGIKYDPPDECRRSQGSAVIVNVNFAHCGQRHSSRACVSFAAGMGAEYQATFAETTSMALVANNTFADAYNFAVSAAGNGIIIENNAIAQTYHGGFEVSGANNTLSNNAAVRLFDDVTDYFHDVGSVGFKLSGSGKWYTNVVASVQYTGFKISGYPCEMMTPDVEDEASGVRAVTTVPDAPMMRGLRAYGGMVGVNLQGGRTRMVTREPAEAYAPLECRQWSDFEIRSMLWYGVTTFGQGKTSIVLKNFNLWDTGLGFALWLVNGGSAAGSSSERGHFAEISDTTIIGSATRCRNDGIGFPAFYLRAEPYRPDQGVKTPSRFGGTTLRNIRFRDFGACGKNGVQQNYALVNAMNRGRYVWVYYDNANPVRSSGLSFKGVPFENRLLMIHPSRGRIGNMKWGCAQMYCDGHRNTFVMDEDGSLLGDNAAFGTVLPENEIGWFKKLAYVDPLNRDILEDLVPFTHQWLPNGTKLTPMRGKLYDEPGHLKMGCRKEVSWQAWLCPEHRHRQIVHESLDVDHANRRISPTSVLTELPSQSKRFMSLYTGPAKYGGDWAGKITRHNTLWITGHVGATHTIHHSSTNPSISRVTFADATEDEAVHVKLYYGVPNRVDVYVDGRYVPPLANITWDQPDVPDISSSGTLETMPHGANFYNRLNGYLEFVLRGPKEVQIRVSNIVVLSATVTVTEDTFFVPGIKALVNNIRLLLNIPEERIAVAGVGDFKLAKQIAKTETSSLGSSGNSTEHTIELLIEEPTTTQLSSSEEDVENVDPVAEANAYVNSSSELTSLARRLQQNAQNLTLGTALGLTNSTLPIEKSPIDVVVGWTCETRAYNDGTCDCDCGAWDPDCDGGQTILRGCPSHAEINRTGTPFEFANSVRAYCVNNSDVVTCGLAVPPDDLCNEWPCVDSAPSDALVSYLQRASSNALTCVKRQSSPNAVHTGECALSMLDERGNTLEPIQSWNFTDLPASPQSQTSSSVPSSSRPDVPPPVPSSPRPDVPAPVPSSPRPDAPHRGPSRESAQARRDRRRNDRARRRQSIRRLQRKIARRFSVSQEDLRNATTLSSIVELAQAEVQEAQRSVSTLQTKYVSAKALYKGNRTATNKAARRRAKINLRNGRKQLRRTSKKLELLEELSRALTTPEQGGTFALGMGNPRGRENSMLVVAVAIGACAMAFIAVRSHRRANERLYVDESTPLLSRRT